MSDNKKVREQLERMFGKECFIEKLNLRTGKKEHYKSKGQLKRMKQLTYHHIRPRSKGGRSTVENGALLSAENHAWFHKQNEKEQERMNRAFQDYKLGIAIIADGRIEQCQEIKFDRDDDYIVIPVETSKQRRSREKRETRRAWEDFENDK